MVANMQKTDQQIIKDLGGPTKLARMLGYTKKGGSQRVQNWLYRGIPAHVKIKFPEFFMPDRVSGIDNRKMDFDE